MKKFLKKVIPSHLKRQIISLIESYSKENNRVQEALIPKRAFNSKTISNARLLVNREELLKLLPKNGTIAELGVDEGFFSEQILKICDPQKLILVDLWGSERFNQEKRKIVEQKFFPQIKSGKVQIEIGYSIDVGERFLENTFDWIYIDTDHSYKTTLKELEIWAPKVKENGIISGHDFVIGSWKSMVRYGVIEAVNEFCSKYNWEIIYLTMDYTHPSFAIRKIDKLLTKSKSH